MSSVPSIPGVACVPGVRLSQLSHFPGVPIVPGVPGVYGYHDCAMDILTCVTEMFANRHNLPGDNSTQYPLIDDRRYRPLSPPSVDRVDRVEEDSTWPRRQNTQTVTPRPPVKPASLPSLQLNDNGRRPNKKRHKKWAYTSYGSDADAEFSDATTADFTQ